MNSIRYEIFSLPKYNVTKAQIPNIAEKYTLPELVKLLKETDKCYHLRLKNDINCIFFGDLDNMECEFTEWATDMITFLEVKYNIITNIEKISYTINSSKKGSFHYSIPTIYGSIEKIKEIHNNFIKEYSKKFCYTISQKNKSCIDTSIYGEKWFRLPYQSKESIEDTQHKIIKGKIEDFIVIYIPKYSININNKVYNQNITGENNDTKIVENKKICNNKKILGTKKENTDILKNIQKSPYISQFTIYKKFIDTCYKQERFENYDFWINFGMAIKNIYGACGYHLFDYFSSKGTNYENTDATQKKYNSFEENGEGNFGIGSIYYWAKEDNEKMYKTILCENDINLTEYEFAKKIFEIASDRFLYVKVGENNYKLYCYNGKYWECNDILFKQYISSELYNFYKDLLASVYWDHHNFAKLRNQVENLKRNNFKQSIIEAYKEFAIKDIRFDSNWFLFGFNNCVYDLTQASFRDYRKDDFVSMVTGYDWRQPTEEEINTMTSIINNIMPDNDIRQLYLEILSTSLEGECLEKFIVFNGDGRNGKGLIDDLLLLALGDYGICANNSILFEKAKTGSNPEKANLHKKRLVIFKEPASKNKFENSIVKELTGGGKFSARTHNEKETEKLLYNTTICECNKRPLFAEEPSTAEICRLIDIYFGSTFTDIIEDVDHSNFIFLAKKEYKDSKFQEKHKFALIHILINSYKNYFLRNRSFDIPKSIKDRTIEYLESSCNLLMWFKENYKHTNDKHKMIPISDILAAFKMDEYYTNLTKFEKRKYNLKFFIEYFSHNIITKKFYKKIIDYIIDGKRIQKRNVLINYKIKKKFNSDIDSDIGSDIDSDIVPYYHFIG